jgi:predicted phage-related endonuclease
VEDKAFELLSKMYGEFTERFDEMGKDIKGLKSDVKGLKNDVKGLKNDVVCIENKLDNNSKALFDGYKQTYEEVVDVKKLVIELSSKVEKQDVEIRVIRGGAAKV